MIDGISQELRDYAGRIITFEEMSVSTKRILGRYARGRVMDELTSGAIEIRNEIVMSMRNSPAAGKRYRIGTNKRGKGVYHRASAPGNPPRPNSGDLIRSIVMDVRWIEVEVGSDITKPAYPAILEKGSPKTGLLPRPWLKPAVDRWLPRINFNMRRVQRDVANEIRE